MALSGDFKQHHVARQPLCHTVHVVVCVCGGGGYREARLQERAVQEAGSEGVIES